MKTLKQLKTEATRKEQCRVYDNFNLPPQDITVAHETGMYARRAWQSGRNFGWGKWQRVKA